MDCIFSIAVVSVSESNNNDYFFEGQDRAFIKKLNKLKQRTTTTAYTCTYASICGCWLAKKGVKQSSLPNCIIE